MSHFTDEDIATANYYLPTVTSVRLLKLIPRAYVGLIAKPIIFPSFLPQSWPLGLSTWGYVEPLHRRLDQTTFADPFQTEGIFCGRVIDQGQLCEKSSKWANRLKTRKKKQLETEDILFNRHQIHE